ncbi:MAG: hypothetical protein M1838_001136 [Thelocarpon superellum]|nr:MAG: hypothetical protein M1838_001136 [Thelocarpon superellum]
MSDDSDDDLEITKVVQRELAHGVPLAGRSDHDSDATADLTQDEADNDPGQKEPETDAGEKVSFSDDDGRGVYETFKNRKSRKRKRAVSAKQKIKPTGIHTADASKNRLHKPQAFGDESDDMDLMEDSLPDFLRQRRAQFEANKARLKEAGLHLPPSYEDVEFSDDDNIRHLKEKPQLPLLKPVAPYKDVPFPYSLGTIPGPIAQWLRDYQVEGAGFLHELFVYQRGGVLGDDMGLGKTIQVIAFLTAAFGKTGDERDAKRMRKMRRQRDERWYPRALVVCPGTLIENWKGELARWGWWHVDVYHGDGKEMALDAAKSGRLEVMITTYVTYRLNKSAINMITWDCVIADECHIIKERRSEVTQAMNEVNALCRIGLTGTAIQNKYEELWTLLNWTNPGRFGPISTWKRSISEPLRLGQSHDATVSQLSIARKTAKKLVENLLPQFFLRRMKSLIADQLPRKSDKVVFCPLTDTQRDAYEAFLDSDVVQYIKRASEPCDCLSGKKRGWCCHEMIPGRGPWRNYVFPAISHLQKFSNHLAILIPQGTDGKEKQAKDLEMLQIALPDHWRELYRNRDSILNFSNPEFFGKWKVLKKLLRFWHTNGDKVLVFSHNVRLLKMLHMLFTHTSYNVSYLDGAMSYEERARMVVDFNSDPGQFVFLLSTRAGGVGLNITSANKVVILDPNWNPSHDLQAQDRAYRIGQVRDVEVFRLVSAGTIEEIVYARQIYKQQQANIGYTASMERRYFKGVQGQRDQKGEIFGLTNLFTFGTDDVVLREIVNKTNVAESRAGVDVVGLDLTQAEVGEDEVMSQLEELVRDETSTSTSSPGNAPGKKAFPQPTTTTTTTNTNTTTTKATTKTDAIQAILASAGISYTHENSEVIGTSRVEAQLSKRATEFGSADPDVSREFAFRQIEEDEGDEAFHHGEPPSDGNEEDEEDATGGAARGAIGRGKGRRGTTVKYRYHPPPTIQRRQFCTMARRHGFSDATEFALVVDGWTQEKRRECLEAFYRWRREVLSLA